MLEPTTWPETFNQDKPDPIPRMVVTKNLDNNENESPVNVPDKSVSIESVTSDRKPDNKTENLSIKFEEDFIDGFLFQSFDTWEDLNVVVSQVRLALFLKLL
jgi:hypothetical protein